MQFSNLSDSWCTINYLVPKSMNQIALLILIILIDLLET